MPQTQGIRPPENSPTIILGTLFAFPPADVVAAMLAYVFTDATLPHEVLQNLLDQGVKRSFNCITVDSDTSTSDTLL